MRAIGIAFMVFNINIGVAMYKLYRYFKEGKVDDLVAFYGSLILAGVVQLMWTN